MQEKKVTLLVTPQQVGGSGEGMLHTERLEIPREYMELARGIEPPTSGLQNPSQLHLPFDDPPYNSGNPAFDQ